jgi:8-oxo-dGTP pyrophosphatase MutT (NUDIX family)
MTQVIETHSAGGVILNKGKVLIVSQRGTSWSLPKGHIEEGEDELVAAKREIYEESGIKESELRFIKKLGSYTRNKIGKNGSEDPHERKRLTFFLFETDQDDLKPVDVDNPEARWILPEEVAEMLTHAKDKEFFREVLKGL